MRILVTNDDGIHAPGLLAAERIARTLSDDVWVVAPRDGPVGVSHSLSLNDPLRLREVGEKRYAVKGTPTDCVIMAVKHILAGEGPDLVSLGVNAARTSPRMSAIPAPSRGHGGHDPRHSLGGAVAVLWSREPPSGALRDRRSPCAGIIRTILEEGLRPGSLINVNFPNRSPEPGPRHPRDGTGPARPGDPDDRPAP